MASEEPCAVLWVFSDLDGTLLDTRYLHTYSWWRHLTTLVSQCPWPPYIRSSAWAVASC